MMNAMRKKKKTNHKKKVWISAFVCALVLCTAAALFLKDYVPLYRRPLSEDEKQSLISRLNLEAYADSEDIQDRQRYEIVSLALDSIGNIPYYWGGTAVVPGFEGNAFGTETEADAHDRTLKGLDCSHFVDWVYWTVTGDDLDQGYTGVLYAISRQISEEELQPGDIGLIHDGTSSSNHVGIYAGEMNGKKYWIHDTAGIFNNVIISTYDKFEVFMRCRPFIEY